MMPKYKQIRLLQEIFKVKQTEITSRLIQAQGAGNWLLGIVINYQRQDCKCAFQKGF